jgi:hypothetical protein
MEGIANRVGLVNPGKASFDGTRMGADFQDRGMGHGFSPIGTDVFRELAGVEGCGNPVHPVHPIKASLMGRGWTRIFRIGASDTDFR